MRYDPQPSPLAGGLAASDSLDWLAALRLPQFTHPDSAWLEHTPFASWIIEALQPSSFVELGTHHAVSYFAFCQAIRDTGLDCRASAIDSWIGDEHAGFYGEDIFQAVTALNDMHFSGFSRLVRSSFDDAARYIAAGSIDLLHIDGLHTYQAVRHDFETWRPLLSDRAVVLFHDSSVRERDFGVWRVFAELAEQHPSFEFLHGQGLGVIGVGSQFPPRIARLFRDAGDPQATRIIRLMFAHLGAHVTARTREALALARADASSAQAAAAEQRLRDLPAVIDDKPDPAVEIRTAQIALLERHLNEMAQTISDQADIIRDREGRLGATEASVARLAMLDASLHELGKTVSLQAEIIRNHEATGAAIERLNATHADFQSVITREVNQKRELENRAAERARLVAQHTTQLHQRDQLVAELTAQRDTLLAAAAQHTQDLERLRAQHAADADISADRLRAQLALVHDAAHRREQQAAEHAAQLQEALDHLVHSTAWRITWPIRALFDAHPAAALMARRTAKLGWWTLRGQLPRRIREWREIRRTGRPGSGTNGRLTAPALLAPAAAAARRWTTPLPADVYDCWLADNPWTARQAALLGERLAAAPDLPTIAVVMPVYRPELTHLRRAIDSVRQQVFTSWELCIADDASGIAEVSALLQQYAASDPRIRVTFRDQNGHISRATNSAADLAISEFLVLLDQDDELAPDALAELALYLAANPDTDLLYSDSDKIDAAGRRHDPHFKPAFSPELLLGYMYAGQTLCVRTSLWRELGGLQPGYEGSQDHDFALRASERARKVGHVAKVLYHWRSLPGSTALSGDAKPYSFEAGRRAVQDALDRRGSHAIAYRPDWAIANGNSLFHLKGPDQGPSVTIIIPTRNKLNLLRLCITSLARTRYRNFTVLVVDTKSDDKATLAWLAELPRRTDIACTVMHLASDKYPGFNFSHVVNQAVATVQTDYVVLLNNDTEVVNPDWLSNMVAYAQLPGVGCVGGLLRFPNGEVQHAGITQTDTPPGIVDHSFKHAASHDAGFLSYIQLPRNTVGVTAACLLVSRALYVEVGGFDEQNFAVAYNDVDFCYRLAALGYRHVYSPTVEFIHHEGATRGFRDQPSELAALQQRYGGRGDPYRNANLCRRSVHLLVKPTHVQPPLARPLRVVLVTHNLRLEGAPKAILETCLYLARAGTIRPVVFSPLEGPLRAVYEAAGIEVVVGPTPLSEGRGLAEYERGLIDMGRVLRDFGAELVLANTLQAFYAIDAAHEAGLPCLWVVHESEGWRGYFDFVSPGVERRALACFGHPYRVVFVAEATRKLYAELDFHHNATVVPGGLDRSALEPFLAPGQRAQSRHRLGVAADVPVILALGTVCDRKGQLDLIAALALIDPSAFSPAPQVFIVGDRDGPYSRLLHGERGRLAAGWDDRVHIVPETPEVWDYYAAADVFVFTSRLESYPRVIMEAMAFGLPIVTTPVNGIVEQVRPGVNAEFYQPADVTRLAELITGFLHDPARRAAYGANAVEVLRSLNTSEDTARGIGELMIEAAGAGVPSSRLGAFHLLAAG